jgi:hypothetical protein
MSLKLPSRNNKEKQMPKDDTIEQKAVQTVTTSQVDMSVYGATGNLGDNDFDRRDLTYGWLKIAQTNSQVATKGHAKFIPGMQAGMFYDTLTNTILGEKINLIFLKYFRTFVEYSGTKQKKVYVRTIPEKEYRKMEAEKRLVYVEGDGTRTVDTNNMVNEFCNYMVLLPDHLELGVLRFSLGMGSVKQAVKWNTMIDTAFIAPGVKAKKWNFIWELSLSLDTNTKNNSTYWNIGNGSKANATRMNLVPAELAGFVIETFKFFQQTNEETIDNAGASAYHDGDTEDENPL